MGQTELTIMAKYARSTKPAFHPFSKTEGDEEKEEERGRKDKAKLVKTRAGVQGGGDPLHWDCLLPPPSATSKELGSC